MHATGTGISALICCNAALCACSTQTDVEQSTNFQPSAEALDVRDVALGEKVKRRLTAGAQLHTFGIEVTARQGYIVLHGATDTVAQREQMGLTAAAVVGVRGVDNRLRADRGNPDLSTGN